MTLKQQLYTVWAFFTVSLKRLFRDRLALFFTFMFPLIFLIIFGFINSGNGNITFKVAVINQSNSSFAKQFAGKLRDSDTFKVDKSVTNMAEAKQQIQRSQIDGVIVLPAGFGDVKQGQNHPSGQAVIYFTRNNEQAGRTLVTVLEGSLKSVNQQFVDSSTPFTVAGQAINSKSLRSFDYAFTGIMGFAILGAGIFGPMNVFPELKKMGILRRLHTTPLRVWQYFLSNMLSNSITGLLSIAAMFVVAILVFHLKIVGNLFELTLFLTFGIMMVLGIGLALGGWAKNERQVAPLGNIIVFPMMFLTGVFIPRFLMPDWLQNLSFYMPLTPVIDGARMILSEGKSLLDLGPQLGIMAVWMVIIYAIAFRVFRWE
ncbi:ABC transporter permease [Candidatus Saccharibacteria bacterium]|nr:ABC transporter permease [Candidatus Saccharibacteria bacterium]